MHTPLPGIKARLRLGAAAATAVVAVFGLSTYAVTAGAAPQPSLAQAQAEVNQDNSQYDQANQQYDQVAQQVKQAQQKLAAVDNQLSSTEKFSESHRIAERSMTFCSSRILPGQE